MIIQLNPASSEPAYTQVAAQIQQLIRDGLLEAGTKLPSVRSLARQLGVSVTTIHAAYDLLAAERLVDTLQGSGTYVTAQVGAATGLNLRTRAELNNGQDEYEPMDWSPFAFDRKFFLIPPYKHNNGNLIRFTKASPDPTLYPFKKIKQTVTNMLWSPQELFFDRGHPQGYLPLVEYLEKEMALAGVPMAEGENDIIITNGFQRALSVILRMLVKRGAKVAVEAPTYSAILNLLIAERIGYVAIPMDSQGMDTDYLAAALKRENISAVISIPTYHNPTGFTLSPSRRAHLTELSAKHKVPIIEDDWGRRLRYEGESPPPLKAIDPGGYVIHIGTFSKCFLPGLRLGWVTCPSELARNMVYAKLGADQGDSYFLQALMYEFIAKGYFDQHLRKSIKEYKRRRNAMVKALREQLPAGCSFNEPQGGFSIWLKLPPGIKSLPLLELSRQAGVDFLPAAYCMPDRQDTSALRLTFSRTPLEDIPAGIEILCDTIKRCIEDPRMLDTQDPSEKGNRS